MEEFEQSSLNWQDYFELRKTPDRGIGVFTKRGFKKGSLLGWYCGEILPSHHPTTSAYLMSMEVGFSQDIEGEGSSSTASEHRQYDPNPHSPERLAWEANHVYIDASCKGNWTRFLNHSCRPHCGFVMARVGDVRVMGVQAVRDVAAGVELTVSYGDDYYGPSSKRICCCGTERCVGDVKRRGITVEVEEDVEEGGDGPQVRSKTRVKKCRRKGPLD